MAEDADLTLYSNVIKKQHYLQLWLPDVKTSSVHLHIWHQEPIYDSYLDAL